jgi:hypothetical protein
MRPLAAVALGVALAACSMKSPPGPQRTTSSTHPPLPGEGPRERIERLSAQIRQWRTDAALAEEPASADVTAMADVTPADAAATCAAPPAGGTCGEVCELGDSICDNAAAICELADQLAGDAWAEGKCDSAKASCREAEERCCACGRPTVGMP